MQWENLRTSLLHILENIDRPATLKDIRSKLPAIVVISDDELEKILNSVDGIISPAPSLWAVDSRNADWGLPPIGNNSKEDLAPFLERPKAMDKSRGRDNPRQAGKQSKKSGPNKTKSAKGNVNELQAREGNISITKPGDVVNDEVRSRAIDLLVKSCSAGESGGLRIWRQGLEDITLPEELMNQLAWKSEGERWYEVEEQVGLTKDKLLTHLEVEEAKYAQYGFFDTTTTGSDLMESFHDRAVAEFDYYDIYKETALRLLREEGLVIPLNDAGEPGAWRLRSRMGEVVRLLNSLRQRFPDQRYYYESSPLAEDIKYHVRARHIPARDITLEKFLRTGTNDVLLAKVEDSALLEKARDILSYALKENDRTKFSEFQRRSFKHIFGKSYTINSDTRDEGLVISAGTGSGKTLAFFAPALLKVILEKVFYAEAVLGTKLLALYPRTKLAENQFEEFVRYAFLINRALKSKGIKRAITVGMEYGNTPYLRAHLSKQDKMKKRNWPYENNLEGHICPYTTCPACGKPLYTPLAQDHPQFGQLVCSGPGCEVSNGLDFVILTKEDWAAAPPDILVALTESLNNRLNSPAHQSIFGIGGYCSPRFVMLDEIHLQSSIKGMQVGFLIRRLLQRIRYHQYRSGVQARIQVIGLSATISEPRRFFKDLTGIRQRIAVESPLDPEEMTIRGAEYLILLQASRSGAVLSAMIQAAMCLIHNMAQPPEGELYQTFGFVNSRDVLYRWRDQMMHAERQNINIPDTEMNAQGLHFLRHPDLIRTSKRLRSYMVTPVNEDCRKCSESPDPKCPIYREGECWWMMGRRRTLKDPIRSVAKSAWSGEFDTQDHLVMATSALEVGYDYNKLMAVLQYLSPPDLAGFVQRRGRAGRSVGSRPIMLNVLSPHRNKDNFYFYNDHLLSDPNFMRLPLNPNNLLVQRIHGLYAVFDWLAYEMALRGITRAFFPLANNVWYKNCIKLTAAPGQKNALTNYLSWALCLAGARGKEDLGRVVSGPRGVLSHALPRLVRYLSKKGQGDVKVIMNHYLPSALFNDINLPEIEIKWGGSSVKERIDIGLQETMVGKVTYRWEQAMWVPPELLERHLPTCYTLPMENYWQIGSKEGTLERAEVPLKWQSLLMGRSIQDELPVLRPQGVSLRTFFYNKDGKRINRWVYDPLQDKFKERGEFEKIGERLRVSQRSNTYPIITYQVRLPRQSVVWDDQQKLGPLAGAITRIIPANDKSGFMEVTKVTLGAEAGLLCDGQQVSRRIAFRDRERNFAGLGYKMSTDGLRFELDPQLHRRFQPSQHLMRQLKDNFFLYKVHRLAQENEWGNFFAIKNMLEVLQTWIGIQKDEGEDWCSALAEGRYQGTLKEVLDSYYRFSKDKGEEIINLLENEQVRSELVNTWRQAQKTPGYEVVRDILIHSLKHALKNAYQSVAGVEAFSEMGAWARLSVDFPGDIQPVIDLFEYGMYGAGSMRAVQRKIEGRPREFWREVIRAIQHCQLGDEEEFLRTLLSLPGEHLKNIGDLVQSFADSTDIKSRRKIKFEIEGYFREKLGLSPLGQRLKALRRIFANSLDLSEFSGQVLENWRLFREVDLFRIEREESWGRALTTHEVGELFAARIQGRLQQGEVADPRHSPWLVLLKCYQNQKKDDTEARWATIETNCKKPFYTVLFANIKSKKDIERLINMEEEERIDELEEIFDEHLEGQPRDHLNRENVKDFSQGAFDTVEGFSLAYVYYELLGPAGQRTDQNYKAILEGLMVSDRIKRAIRQRVLNTCPDICPTCLAGPCELESPGLSQLMLSRRLLREMLDYWRTTESGSVVEVDAEDSNTKLARKIQRAFTQRMNQEVLLRYSLAQHGIVDRAISHLLDSGVTLPTGETFEVEILGDEEIELYLSGPEGLIYERALGIRGDRAEIFK